MRGMSLSFPYRFDSSAIPKIIFKGMVVVLLIIFFPGLITLGSQLFAGEPVDNIVMTVTAIVLNAGLVTGFGLLIFKKLGGCSGEITQDSVTVAPVTMMGITAEAPTGTFALRNFKALKLEHIQGKKGPHERITLIGFDGTPDIRIAATRRGAGTALAADLAQLLKLPVEEVQAPY